MEVIKIGTRKSKLALWQAKWVQDRLEEAELKSELITFDTKGDKKLDVSISKIGSKGVFTEELEEKLAAGEIDIAVHSAKDMQSTLPDDFEIIAFTSRELPYDVIVSDKQIDLKSSETVLGTSSTRRIAFLKHYYPQVRQVDMRGNLQTRIEKMQSGDCDGLVLALAGVKRMGLESMVQHRFDPTEIIPAVGQGSIAVESHSRLHRTKRKIVRAILNDIETEQHLLAERTYLAAMDGGCSIPIFALADGHQSGIRISGGIISLDGSKKVVKTITGEGASSLGFKLAQEVKSAGGEAILEEILNQL